MTTTLLLAFSLWFCLRSATPTTTLYATPGVMLGEERIR